MWDYSAAIIFYQTGCKCFQNGNGKSTQMSRGDHVLGHSKALPKVTSRVMLPIHHCQCVFFAVAFQLGLAHNYQQLGGDILFIIYNPFLHNISVRNIFHRGQTYQVTWTIERHKITVITKIAITWWWPFLTKCWNPQYRSFGYGQVGVELYFRYNLFCRMLAGPITQPLFI